jgi:hypothetical protein
MKNDSTEILKRYIELQNLFPIGEYVWETISEELASDVIESIGIDDKSYNEQHNPFNENLRKTLMNMFIVGYKVGQGVIQK